MYHDNPDIPARCSWCGGERDTTLMLCSTCEEKAKRLKPTR